MRVELKTHSVPTALFVHLLCMYLTHTIAVNHAALDVVSTGYGCVDQQHRSVDPLQACRQVGLYGDSRQLLEYVSSCQHVFDCYDESASYLRRSLAWSLARDRRLAGERLDEWMNE